MQHLTPEQFQALAVEHGGLVTPSLAGHLTGVSYSRVMQLINNEGKLTPICVNGWTLVGLDELKSWNNSRTQGRRAA